MERDCRINKCFPLWDFLKLLFESFFLSLYLWFLENIKLVPQQWVIDWSEFLKYKFPKIVNDVLIEKNTIFSEQVYFEYNNNIMHKCITLLNWTKRSNNFRNYQKNNKFCWASFKGRTKKTTSRFDFVYFLFPSK